jgi:hypothetical protein
VVSIHPQKTRFAVRLEIERAASIGHKTRIRLSRWGYTACRR